MKRMAAALSLGMAAGLTVGFAGPAEAVSQSGTYNCAATWTARMTSDTTGSTQHRWTSTSTGASKIYNLSGGVNATYGYAGGNQWVLVASTIASRSLTCIQ